MSLGVGVFHGDEASTSVVNALKCGMSFVDNAMMQGNHEAVGEGLKRSGLKRDQFQVSNKVGYYPANSEGLIHPWATESTKGNETEDIDKCLKALGVDYIDYMYIHNPITTPEEFRSGWTPHMFQWANSIGKEWAVKPLTTIDGDDVRELLSEARCKRHRDSGINYEQALEVRMNSWRALEKAQKAGKVKMIGVSNYPAAILRELATYAEIMPALHQIEFHPKCQMPETYKLC